MEKIKVVIVDDDPEWVGKVSQFLKQVGDFIVAGIAMTHDEAISLAQQTEVDVFLFDIVFSDNGMDGIATAQEIREHTDAKMIILTTLKEGKLIKQSFLAGAVDYLSKEDFTDLSKSIRRALDPESPMQVVLSDYARLHREQTLQVLTETERKIIDLIEQGCTYSQICEKLVIAHSTLRSHIKKILRKLGVKSSKEALQLVKYNTRFHEG